MQWKTKKSLQKVQGAGQIDSRRLERQRNERLWAAEAKAKGITVAQLLIQKMNNPG